MYRAILVNSCALQTETPPSGMPCRRLTIAATPPPPAQVATTLCTASGRPPALPGYREVAARDDTALAVRRNCLSTLARGIVAPVALP